MPSFDCVSEIDAHELSNAVDQANRELETRFDFKGVKASYTREEFGVVMEAPEAFQLKQMLEILKMRIAKRGIDVGCLEEEDLDKNLARARQKVVLRHGIDAESGKKLQKAIKESKLKVTAAIQGDKLRVTGKSRDDLQAAIALLRKTTTDRPLQFNNFRD
jgi:cyclic-di-GMP-binding protein